MPTSSTRPATNPASFSANGSPMMPAPMMLLTKLNTANGMADFTGPPGAPAASNRSPASTPCTATTTRQATPTPRCTAQRGDSKAQHNSAIAQQQGPVIRTGVPTGDVCGSGDADGSDAASGTASGSEGEAATAGLTEISASSTSCADEEVARGVLSMALPHTHTHTQCQTYMKM